MTQFGSLSYIDEWKPNAKRSVATALFIEVCAIFNEPRRREKGEEAKKGKARQDKARRGAASARQMQVLPFRVTVLGRTLSLALTLAITKYCTHTYTHT